VTNLLLCRVGIETSVGGSKAAAIIRFWRGCRRKTPICVRDTPRKVIGTEQITRWLAAPRDIGVAFAFNVYSLHIHLLGGEVDAGGAHEHDHAADDDHHGHDLKHASMPFSNQSCTLFSVQSNWTGKHQKSVLYRRRYKNTLSR
jgi:hypothetical protein